MFKRNMNIQKNSEEKKANTSAERSDFSFVFFFLFFFYSPPPMQRSSNTHGIINQRVNMSGYALASVYKSPEASQRTP